MFGSITRFNTENGEFNNALGTQINVNYRRGAKSTSSTVFGSSTNSPGPQNPFSTNPFSTNPAPIVYPPQRPPKSHGIFSSKPKQNTESTESTESTAVAVTLGVTDYVLTSLQNASRFSGVPFLPEAATAALSILQGIQVWAQNIFMICPR